MPLHRVRLTRTALFDIILTSQFLIMVIFVIGDTGRGRKKQKTADYVGR